MWRMQIQGQGFKLPCYGVGTFLDALLEMLHRVVKKTLTESFELLGGASKTVKCLFVTCGSKYG